MQTVKPSHDNTYQRSELRMRIPGLSVSMCREGLLSSLTLTPCSLFDINYGGMSILSDYREFSVTDKVKLFLNYQNNEFKVQGVVTYKNAKENKTHYGIIFTKVPFALDCQLDAWRQSTEMVPPLLEEQVRGAQKRSEKRYRHPHFLAKVTSTNPLEKIKQFTANVINVSSHGLRFSSPLFHQPIDSAVSLDVCYGQLCFSADGVVKAIIATESGYQYGVKVTTKNTCFTSFVERHIVSNTPEEGE